MWLVVFQILFEATVKGIPQRVLGSASYQVGKMDVLNVSASQNRCAHIQLGYTKRCPWRGFFLKFCFISQGTPALFLILLLYNSSMLAAYIEDERFVKSTTKGIYVCGCMAFVVSLIVCLWVCRFFQCLQTLVGCGLSGPTSPLAFVEAVLGAISRSAGSLQNKEQLWRTWSVVVSPLTDTITQVSSTHWAVCKGLMVMLSKMAWRQVKWDEKDQNPTSANRIQHDESTEHCPAY